MLWNLEPLCRDDSYAVDEETCFLNEDAVFKITRENREVPPLSLVVDTEEYKGK